MAFEKEIPVENDQESAFTKKQYAFIILVLGSLTTISPFSIDMYLPAFPELARDLKTSVASIQLSLTSYFIGIAFGQLVYGPLLDRFGRKSPVYIGMGIYVITSVACIFANTSDTLIVMRFLQALGGCASMVAARAFVRDLFPVNETAKIFSTLMLVIAVSPMIAPTVGSYVTLLLGWRYVFVVLAVVAALITLGLLYLPQGKTPDPAFSLRPRQLAKNYISIFKQKQFYTYAAILGISSTALFAYVSASPDVFINIYGADKTEYGWIFAFISVGLIGSAQVNRFVLNHFKIEKIVTAGMIWQIAIGTILIFGTTQGWLDTVSLTLLTFGYFCGFGFVNPNAAALALAPFYKEAGSASALMGAIQMAMGVLASVVVSLWHNGTALPMATVLILSAAIGLAIFLAGRHQGSV